MSTEFSPPDGLEIIIPFLPPTSNHIYKNRRGGGGRFLSREAEAWQRRFLHEVIGPYQPSIYAFCNSVESDDTSVLGMWLTFYFNRNEVINTTYKHPDIPPAKQAKDRYKKMDVQNRCKLITDSLYKALALDDKLNFTENIEKCIATDDKPKVRIRLRRCDPKYFGVL
jgi:Holliday junction resolvase RusA-like endonuclease